MRVWRVLIVLLLGVFALPVTAHADDGVRLAGGTIRQCPGYPVPPFDVQVRDGVTLTTGLICHVYAGTVAGVVSGIQHTRIEADGSRTLRGRETLVGNVAGRLGTAEFRFEGSRACFPTCPVTVHVWAVEGTRQLEGLWLDLIATGTGVLSYTGTYSFDDWEDS